MNITDARDHLISVLGDMDLAKMSLNDLTIYTQVLRAAAEIPTVDPVDAAITASQRIYSALAATALQGEGDRDTCLGFVGG